MPLPRKTSMPRQWNAASMPAPSTIGRITIKKLFELLRGAEQVVATGEQKTGKAMPNLRFRINKERLQMYINLKNPARAKEQLTKLEETAKASHNDSLSNDLLLYAGQLLLHLRHEHTR